MNLRDRIGVGNLENVGLESGLKWAGENEVHFVDFCVDGESGSFGSFSEERVRQIRVTCERHNIHLGLHTLSGVNIAEFSPFFDKAVDEYLRAYIDLSKRLGSEWVVVHSGYHFTSDYKTRRKAALEHLNRAVEYAEKVGALLLMENMNREPDNAEIHYLGYNIEECSYFFDAISSANFGWAFTINHAHLVPEEGINGFLDAFSLKRCHEVRLADNRGDKEQHLQIGKGTIDFVSLFNRIKSSGYEGHFMMSLKLLEDMLEGRENILNLLKS